MKILIIDSHKGSNGVSPQNMHWQNAKLLSEYLKADLIWSYPCVNDNIKSDYDIIIFVHASHYSYTDYSWIEKSPNAKLIFITNEYNLGEPRTLWMAAKTGRKYDVIANHPSEASKVVMKYVNNWNILNLNCLVYQPKDVKTGELNFEKSKSGCVYYGSFRKGREKYFKKYLNENVVLSTHSKNIEKFRNIGVSSAIGGRINWDKNGLSDFKCSLYIEDEKTHKHYNYLANRFYESLNYNCVPLFSKECKNTIDLSGYNIGNEYCIDSPLDIKEKCGLDCNIDWHEMAAKEKKNTLLQLENIILSEPF